MGWRIHVVDQRGYVITRVRMGLLRNAAMPLNGPANAPGNGTETDAREQSARNCRNQSCLQDALFHTFVIRLASADFHSFDVAIAIVSADSARVLEANPLASPNDRPRPVPGDGPAVVAEASEGGERWPGTWHSGQLSCPLPDRCVVRGIHLRRVATRPNSARVSRTTLVGSGTAFTAPGNSPIS